MSEPNAQADVALLDAGDGRRLERFGGRIVDRPHPAAAGAPLAPERWASADLRFDRGRGWTGPGDPAESWTATIDGLTLELRATDSGGVGVFPEHWLNARWLEARVQERADADTGPPQVLHLFAHTGLLTLVAARAGAGVAHVDAARGAVAWARRNADLSGLGTRPIRWLVDDALGFVEREARRGRQYDGIVLDPPSYGHAGRREWRLEDDLERLVEACAVVAAPRAFVLLTAHTSGLDETDLGSIVRHAFEPPASAVRTVPLDLPAVSGARLRLGWAIRLG